MHLDGMDILKCDRFADISEYLDGELSPEDELSLELHLARCSECSAEFNLQKQFHNVLASSLDAGPDFTLPENFAKAVATAAESDVSSLRRSNEVRNALMIVAGILGVTVVFAAVGGISAGGVGLVLDKVWAVIAAAGHLIFSLALGISVILRSVTSGIRGQGTVWMVIFGIAALLLILPILYYRPRSSRSA